MHYSPNGKQKLTFSPCAGRTIQHVLTRQTVEQMHRSVVALLVHGPVAWVVFYALNAMLDGLLVQLTKAGIEIGKLDLQIAEHCLRFELVVVGEDICAAKPALRWTLAPSNNVRCG